MKILFYCAAILAMCASLAWAQGLPLDSFSKDAKGNYDTQGKYSCTDAHQQVCMAYCKNYGQGQDCAADCDERMKECRATGAYLIRRVSRTYAVNLRKE